MDRIKLELREDTYYVLRESYHGYVPLLITKDKSQADLMMEYLNAK